MSTIGIGVSSTLAFSNSPVSGPSPITPPLKLAQVQGRGQVTGPDGDGDTQAISKAGQLLSKLQSLQQNDPARFKELVVKISDQLTSAAQQAGTGTQQGLSFSQLANAFKNVASGDISQLRPPDVRGSRLQQAYGLGQQSGQQAFLEFINHGGQRSSIDPSTRNVFTVIRDELKQATSNTTAE
jgi:hypothetical protein